MDLKTVIPIALPAGFALFPALIALVYGREIRRRGRIRREGLSAPGRCLARVHRRTSHFGDERAELRHRIGFTDARGQWTEFQEESSLSLREGDAVTVYYLAADPRATATTDQYGLAGPRAIVAVLLLVSAAATLFLVRALS
ncbi:DUF3592 domain-containing protein [Streptomyces polyrhachis]|uniref:DUF3592 domain-containing protein n=1 Tax=Streptomyces polyrhachis TaxID=1282885 RepID=A0ABW2G8Y7_9ACTN